MVAFFFCDFFPRVRVFGQVAGYAVLAEYTTGENSGLAALPAGDHGALIRAYKKSGTLVEANASFVIPVYISIPHKTMAAEAKYVAEGTVQSFGISRHYVAIPKDISFVTVTMEVHETTVNGSVVNNCSGVRIYVLEAGNSAAPPEAPYGRFHVANCDANGSASPSTSKVVYTRRNPKAGIWDLHVTGYYLIPESSYKITVEYAKIKLSKTKIVGNPEVVNGSVEFELVDGSVEVIPAAAHSTYSLNRLIQKNTGSVKLRETVSMENSAGSNYRSYASDIAVVTYKTGKSAGNDIDLSVYVCPSAAPEDCVVAGTSGSPTDVEKVTLIPVAGKFYRADVAGYSIKAGADAAEFEFIETETLKQSEAGTLEISQGEAGKYEISYSFGVTDSLIFQNEKYLSGESQIVGDLTLKTAEQGLLVSVPFEISVGL